MKKDKWSYSLTITLDKNVKANILTLKKTFKLLINAAIKIYTVIFITKLHKILLK